MEDQHAEKRLDRRVFFKTMALAAVGIGMSAGPAVAALAPIVQLPLRGGDPGGWRVGSTKQRETAPRTLKKLPFYSHIPPGQIRAYQNYINQAFELSPLLDFQENGEDLIELFERAANEDLSPLDLELMIIQYVRADKYLRQKCRSSWVEKVVGRQEGDFFPDPWTIIAELFSKQHVTPGSSLWGI